MTKRTPDDSLRQRILETMREKDTDELLDIWKNNNRKEWSNEAFDVIHDILAERLGNVPEQNAPFTGAAEDDKSGDKEDADEGGADDVFHDADAILNTASLANVASWIVLLIGAALIVVTLLSDLAQFQGAPQGGIQNAMVFQTLYGVLGNALGPIFYFIVLRAVSQALYVLLDIERNTYVGRKTPS